MAKRHLARRGAPVPQKPVRKPVEPEDVDELEDELEEIDDEEEEDEPVAPRRVSRQVEVEADEDEDDEDGEDDEEEDDDEPVKVVAKRPAPAAPAKKPVPQPVTIKTVEKTIVDDMFATMLDALDDGQAINITRLGENKWQVSLGNAAKAAAVKKKTGKEYWDEVISPETKAWSEKWGAMDLAQKKAYAKKVGAKWEPHDDERIESMRLAQAVRTKEGLEKYKPEYRTRAARIALQNGM